MSGPTSNMFLQSALGQSKAASNALAQRLDLCLMLLERTMSLASAFAFDVGMLGPEAAAKAYEEARIASLAPAPKPSKVIAP